MRIRGGDLTVRLSSRHSFWALVKKLRDLKQQGKKVIVTLQTKESSSSPAMEDDKIRKHGVSRYKSSAPPTSLTDMHDVAFEINFERKNSKKSIALMKRVCSVSLRGWTGASRPFTERVCLGPFLTHVVGLPRSASPTTSRRA